MKILLVYKNGRSRIGGVESWLISLYRTFRAWGCECEAFWLGENLLRDNVELRDGSHSGSLAQLMQFLVAREFDVIHATTADWDAGVTILRRSSPGAKLVLTHHLETFQALDSTNCDALTSCSRWAGAEQQTLTDLPVRVILNGIDTEEFSPARELRSGPPILAWVGRGSALRHKGIDKLAAIAPALASAGVRLWIADPDGPSRVLPEAARILAPLAEVWQEIPRGSMADFYRDVAASGGCVLSTSAYEGLPLSLVEPQACGCPAIGPDIRGVNECVDPNRGGILYRSDTPTAELAGIIISALYDRERMAERRLACAAYARECFSLTRMAKEYFSVYEQVLASRTNPATATAANRFVRRGRRQMNVREGWPAGDAQYQAAVNLMQCGERGLARQAAWSSFLTCPLLYVRPRRLFNFVRAVVGARHSSRVA